MMETTIVYGLVIKTWTLLVAAHAFSKIRPVLLTLDMISLRKSMGAVVQDETNFSTLPQEIIEIIRKEFLPEMSKEASEIRFPEWNEPRDCSCDGKECGCERVNQLKLGEDSWSDLDVSGGKSDAVFMHSRLAYPEYIDDEIQAVSFQISLSMHSFQLKYIRILMFLEQSGLFEFYGLHSTPSKVYSTKLNELYSAVFINIPTNSITIDANDPKNTSPLTLTKFNPSKFDTASADRRLIQFVRDFGLKVYEENVREIAEDTERNLGEVEGVEEEKGKREKEKGKMNLQKIEPSWMMVSSIIPI